MSRTAIGSASLDLLESMHELRGPVTVPELVEQTGRKLSLVHAAVTRMARQGLVRRVTSSVSLGRRGRTPAEWEMTGKGRRELLLRLRAGCVPGVVNTGPSNYREFR